MFKKTQIIMFVSAVSLLITISSYVMGQAPPPVPQTRVGKMNRDDIFSNPIIPDQKNELVNKLVSQSYLVY